MAEQKQIHETIRTTLSFTCMLVLLAGCTDEGMPEAAPLINEVHTSDPLVNVTTREQGKGRQRTYSDNDFMHQFQSRPARERTSPWSQIPPDNYSQHRKNERWLKRPGKLQHKNPWLQPESAAGGTGWNSPTPPVFEKNNNPWGSGSYQERPRQQKNETVWTQSEKRDNGWEGFSVDDSYWYKVPNGGFPESDDPGSIW